MTENLDKGTLHFFYSEQIQLWLANDHRLVVGGNAQGHVFTDTYPDHHGHHWVHPEEWK